MIQKRSKFFAHRVPVKMASALVFGLVIVLILGLAVTPALSELRPGLKLSKAIGKAQRNYPDPLIGVSSANQSSLFVGETATAGKVDSLPGDCATEGVRTCDTIDFDLDAPAQADPNAPYTTKFTLNWEPGSSSNNLDFLVWQCTNVSDRVGCARVKRAAGSAQGEEVTGVQDLPGRRYAIVVQNMAGVNEGYAFKVEWLDGKFVEFPRAKPQTSVPPDTRSVREPPDRPPAGADTDTTEEEKAKLKAARTPGPDGPLTSTEIAALGRQSEAASDRSPIPWLALGLVLALGGVATFILVRRRLAARGEATKQ